MVTVQDRAPAPESTCSGSDKDERWEVEARAALQASVYRPVREVQCAYRDGAVTLSGVVSCYYLKQIAQCEVRRRLERVVICNLIEVAPQTAQGEDASCWS